MQKETITFETGETVEVESTSTTDIEKQRERGKRGGVKNKGFIWYTDGVNSYKYTKKEQEELSFDQFLQQNKQYRKGRTLWKLNLSLS